MAIIPLSGQRCNRKLLTHFSSGWWVELNVVAPDDGGRGELGELLAIVIPKTRSLFLYSPTPKKIQGRRCLLYKATSNNIFTKGFGFGTKLPFILHAARYNLIVSFSSSLLATLNCSCHTSIPSLTWSQFAVSIALSSTRS